MRVTSKGQVTIPQAVREEAGIAPGTEVDFLVDRDGVRLVKARKAKRPTKGEKIVARIKGSATAKLTTEQIMALMRGPSVNE